ncbi:MAG: hypothetical protein ACKO04_01295 [Actinomycetes bacterium]
MAEPISVLVVTAQPDQRRSTETLRLLVDYLNRHTAVNVSVWFLRADTDGGDDEPWPGSRVVDDLRSWWLVRPMVGALGARVASGLRGARLRSWLHQVDPAVVVLDDGLCDRVLDAWRRPVVRVVRCNPELPEGAVCEPAPLEHAEAKIVARQSDRQFDGVQLELPFLRRRGAVLPLAAAAQRERVRAELGIPQGVELVVGWGEDSWLDGTDLFLRTLWALEARYAVTPHALWLGLSSDEHEANRLRVEAGRCGLADRFHLHPLTTEEQRYCGDAVVLPTRLPGEDIEQILNAVCVGQVVVATRHDDLPEQAIAVPPLDVEAAASALREGLAGDRDRRFARSRLLDIDEWLDDYRWVERLTELVAR